MIEIYYRFRLLGRKEGWKGQKEKQENISMLADQTPIIRGIPPARRKKKEPHLSKKEFVTHQCKMKDTLSNSKTCPYSSRDKLSLLG